MGKRTRVPVHSALTQTRARVLAHGTDTGEVAILDGTAVGRRTRVADFFELTKPRMNFLVLATTGVGYYMSSTQPLHAATLLATLLGTALTAAAAAALNQYIERDRDALMHRTANRPLPSGRVSPREALFFGVTLAIGGISILAACVNSLTAAIGAFTLLSYVLLYTPLKPVTSLNTVVGAVPGALPLAMGCTAVTGAISREAVALFLIQFVWQMPHFLAIATLYREDYARGGFAMLPVVDKTLGMTGRQIILYSSALIPVSVVPVVLGMAGNVYLTSAVILGSAFLGAGIVTARSPGKAEARMLFIASIIYLPLLLGMMMVNRT